MKWESSGPNTDYMRCGNNLFNIWGMAKRYAQENGGMLPVGKGKNPCAYEVFQFLVKEAKPAHVEDYFRCPYHSLGYLTEKEQGDYLLDKDKIDYTWISYKITLEEAVSKTIVVSCDKYYEQRHDGDYITVLYANGLTKSIRKEELGPGGLEAFIKENRLVE